MSCEAKSNRRIVLVDFYWTRDKDPRIPLGHASLLAALARISDLDVRSLTIPVNLGTLDPEAVADNILREVGDADSGSADIAFGAYVWCEELLLTCMSLLRDRGFEGRMILGGPQIGYAGSHLEQCYPHADIFVRGYGEDALCSLVRTTSQGEVPGVHWAGGYDKCEQAKVDLASLPSPWLKGTIPLRDQSFIRWETQRGCPFRCAFCQHREPGARLTRRTLDQDRIAEEIDFFCSHSVESIAVLDPIFNIPDHAIPILRRFRAHEFRGQLSLQCRAEFISDAFLNATSGLNVRLEFGLQTIHDDEAKAISRPNDMVKVDEVLAEVRRCGIAHEVSLIFGLPLQTIDSFRESVTWCLERKVPVVKAFPLLLLRGTELERQRSKWGLATDGGPMEVVTASSTFSRHEWKEMDRISSALRLTEGRHPASFATLQSHQHFLPTCSSD
ncbi:MAG: radical SAM protein [Phycisphaeraceae bacterium]|nr:radical SAM protein [Phycisphaeraceae bacterium]